LEFTSEIRPHPYYHDKYHTKIMSELLGIKNQFEELQKKYKDYHPDLIYDLLVQQREDPLNTPMYMLEVFTKRGTDPQMTRENILKKTGMVPAIYDNGTHYVTNQKLTMDMLKEISDSNDVLEVSGEYTGGVGGLGASHEQRLHKYNHDHDISSSGEQKRDKKQRSLTERGIIEEKAHKSHNNHKQLLYTLLGIVGAIALVGFIISGGLLPNVNNAAILTSSRSSLPPALGAIQGYVGGPGGLPIIGATVIAHKIQGLSGADQRLQDYIANSIISIDGKYSFTLPAGVYTFTVAFPDGTNQIVKNYAVWSESVHTLDFKYQNGN
jgi:hypothetical protein